MTELQTQTIDDAKQRLLDLYNLHKSDGILALYIWGSITRSDFDPETSDIDVICIVDDSFDIANNEKFKDELTEKAPQREWGFQIIYLDELNGGPIRSRLANAMSPQSILPSFLSWIYICGQLFERTEFSVKDASLDERMRLNIHEIRTRLGNIPTDPPERKVRDRKGIVKACLLLIYNRQLLRSDYFDLDYNLLPEKADQEESPMLKDLLTIKKHKLYDGSQYEPYISKIMDFGERIESELDSLKPKA